MKQFGPPVAKASEVKVRMRRLHACLVIVGLWLAAASICDSHVGGAEPGPPGRAPIDPSRLFHLLDSNRDNRLSKEEVQQLAARGDDNESRREVFERIFAQLDTDDSVELSLGEFAGLSRLRGDTKPPTPAPVTPKAGLPRAALFIRRFDHNGDGALSREESPDHLKAAFDRVDRDSDGKLSREELAPVLERSRERGAAEAHQGDQSNPIHDKNVPRLGDEEVAAVYDFTEFRRLLTEPVNSGRIPCASAILVHNNKVIFKEAMGKADIENNIPFTVDTICHVGSTTKWISGATMMVMVDEGKISLDEPAGKYLPRFKDMPIKGSNLKGNPTIRHCFSGLSGLLGHPDLLRISNTIPLMESVDWIADNVPELGHAPGSGFGHASVGMQIAGGVVETARRQGLFRST